MPRDLHRLVLVNDRGRPIGQDHARAKLTNHEVDLMRDLREGGMEYRELAAKFEVSLSTAHNICSGKRRGHTAVGQRRLNSRVRYRPKPARIDEFDIVPTESTYE